LGEAKNKIYRIVKGADAAVIDSYEADKGFYEHVSRLVKTPVYIDDYKRIDYPRGIVVNGAVYAKEIGYKKRAGCDICWERSMRLLGRNFGTFQRKILKEI